ncbi:MAG: FixH family protein [Phycisphaerae bacterium]
MAAFVNSTGTPVVPPSQPSDANKRFAAIVWPGMVIGLLAMQVAMCAIAITLATRDPSMSVEPNYYQKALHWDDSQAAKARQAAIGWVLKLESVTASSNGASEPRAQTSAPAPSVLQAQASGVSHGGAGTTPLRMRLTDKQGAPLSAASITGEYFHHARANNRAVFTARQLEPGIYEANLTLGRPGLWELRLVATRDADTARFTQIVELSQTGNLIP